MTLKRRIEKKISQTANFTCFSRGCAAHEKDPRFHGPDYLAEKLFPPMARLILKITPLRKFMMQKMFPPGIHAYVLARTKVMDAAFYGALEKTIPQIVLLGAGFDTRAMRFSDRNQGTKIFELDAPITQQAKIEVLKRKQISISKELAFVPINFDREEISDVLADAGYQNTQRTLFLWEGVTMYLSAQAVDKTLAFIRSNSAAGSKVVFDYIFAGVLRKENRYFGEQDAYDTVARAGEGWTFGLEEGEIETFLAERGFKLSAHYTSSDLEKLFLMKPDGSLHARVNGTHCIAEATVG